MRGVFVDQIARDTLGSEINGHRSEESTDILPLGGLVVNMPRYFGFWGSNRSSPSAEYIPFPLHDDDTIVNKPPNQARGRHRFIIPRQLSRYLGRTSQTAAIKQSASLECQCRDEICR